MSRCLTPGLPSPNSEEEVSCRSLVALALPARTRTQSRSEPGLWGRSLRCGAPAPAERSGQRCGSQVTLPSSAGVQLLPPRPGSRIPEGQPGPPSLGSGHSPTDAAESQAQSPVTPEPSVASGLGARKLCPRTVQVKLGSEGGLPSVTPVPCAGLSHSRPQFPHTNFSLLIQSFRNPAFIARLAPGVWRANTRDPRKCLMTLTRTGPEGWDSIIRGVHTSKPDFDGLWVQVWKETTGEQTWEAGPSDTSLSLSQSPERPAALGRDPRMSLLHPNPQFSRLGTPKGTIFRPLAKWEREFGGVGTESSPCARRSATRTK